MSEPPLGRGGRLSHGPDEVVALAEERLLAKQQKDWAKADELRGKIKEMGYSVLDSKEGYELKKL